VSRARVVVAVAGIDRGDRSRGIDRGRRRRRRRGGLARGSRASSFMFFAVIFMRARVMSRDDDDDGARPIVVRCENLSRECVRACVRACVRGLTVCDVCFATLGAIPRSRVEELPSSRAGVLRRAILRQRRRVCGHP